MGHLAAAGHPRVMTTTRPLPGSADRAWRALLVLLALALLVGLAGLVLAAGLAATDLLREQRGWDGLGVALATLVALPSTGVAVLAGSGIRRARRRDGSARGAAAMLAVVLALPAVYGSTIEATWALAALGGALVVAAALARTASPASPEPAAADALLRPSGMLEV